jgi:periplasmic protein CpxP/Spy
MSYRIGPAGHAAAIAFAGALVLLPLGMAEANDTQVSAAFQLAQASSPSRPSGPGGRSGNAPQPGASAGQQGQDADSQISQLRKELNITQAQEQQLNQNPPKNALDDLKAVEQLAEVQANGLKKLVPAFQSLYESLSDQQKKTADTVFGRGQESAPPPSSRRKG